MSVRVSLELGHEASIRTKRTPEGFTHDWEVFVRGAETADVSHFVDRVVFQLHDTFPKPKRVVKEPPYKVKESGYAGFNLPIEVHLKNHDDPKKIRFNYDLYLQPSGPPYKKIRTEQYVFSNPSDEFRRKLLKGGGVPVGVGGGGGGGGTAGASHPNPDRERNGRDPYADERSRQLVGKPKLGGDGSAKKHKREPPRPMNSFENLFGPTIRKTARTSPDPKRPSPNPNPKPERKEAPPRADAERPKPKPEPKREDRPKDEKRSSGPRKDREPREAGVKRAAERPPSPAPPAKRPNAPSSPKRAPSPSDRSNGSASSKEGPKRIPSADAKGESRKPPESTPPKIEKRERKEKKSRDRDRDARKDRKKEREPKPGGSEERPKEKPPRPIKKFSIENMLKDPRDAVKYFDGGDREKRRKHKKRDRKRDGSAERAADPVPKGERRANALDGPERADPIAREPEKCPTPTPRDRSRLAGSPISVDTSSQSSSRSANKGSKPSEGVPGRAIDDPSPSSVPTDRSDASVASDDEDAPKKPAAARGGEPSGVGVDEPARFPNRDSRRSRENPPKSEPREERRPRKRKREESSSKSSKSSEDVDRDPNRRSRSGAGNPPEIPQRRSEPSRSKSDIKVQDDGVSSSLSDNHIKCESPAVEDSHAPGSPRTPNISPDYMIQLKELQRRIMTLQSNEELERVVHLIAETGKYEVTKKTFDFDLCALDRSTVQRLQEMTGCESRA